MPARRFVVIHGHFYQPPRENPWLETVEVQDGAVEDGCVQVGHGLLRKVVR